jgi:tetratricopeptide (TPR) repeat protein
VSAAVNLGMDLSSLGRLPEAIAAFRSAIALDPDHANAHYGLGNALATLADQRGDPDLRPEALDAYRAAAYRRAIELNAGDPRLPARLDEVLEAAGGRSPR